MASIAIEPHASRRLLDPIDRSSEVLFGLIMVLTFIGSISVAESGRAEIRTVLEAAIGCNLAWGIVDAVMYLMSQFTESARTASTVRAVRATRDPETANKLLEETLPSEVADALTPADFDLLRQRLAGANGEPGRSSLERKDFFRAMGVFMLVFLSTIPVVLPFVFMSDVAAALRMSQAIALVMLFITGWSLGTHVGRSGWRFGGVMALSGIVLAGLTMALGG